MPGLFIVSPEDKWLVPFPRFRGTRTSACMAQNRGWKLKGVISVFSTTRERVDKASSGQRVSERISPNVEGLTP